MIITRSPLRISLGGGGTDLPSYYREHTGFLIAAAIDKYVYITLHETFVPDLIIKYSKLERVTSIDEIEHPIIREALRLTEVPASALEISSMADIPAGTGLGSAAAASPRRSCKPCTPTGSNLVHPAELAEQACRIELEKLREPIGKQDQYIAAFGGHDLLPSSCRTGRWRRGRSSSARNPATTWRTTCLLFFTGYSAFGASKILKEQDDTQQGRRTRAMVDNLHFVKDLGRTRARRALGELATWREFGRLMDVHWQRKKERSGRQ